MDHRHDVHVKIGEVKIGEPGLTLKTTLGSCVGIAFSWNTKRLYGLAHCLLPESKDYNDEIGARYVDQAIYSLIKLMKIGPHEKNDIDVFIAGGGDMMAQLERKNKDHIGTLNLQAAKKFLDKFGFKYKELASSGNEARQMIVDCSSGVVSVKTFGVPNRRPL